MYAAEVKSRQYFQDKNSGRIRVKLKATFETFSSSATSDQILNI